MKQQKKPRRFTRGYDLIHATTKKADDFQGVCITIEKSHVRGVGALASGPLDIIFQRTRGFQDERLPFSLTLDSPKMAAALHHALQEYLTGLPAGTRLMSAIANQRVK